MKGISVVIVTVISFLWSFQSWSSQSLSVLDLSDRECYQNENVIAISGGLRLPTEKDSLVRKRIEHLLKKAATDDEKFKANLYTALFYVRSSSPLEAIQFFEKCSHYIDAISDPRPLFVYHFCLGKLYSNRAITTLASEHFELAVSFAEKINDIRLLQSVRIELGVALMLQNDFKKAEPLFNAVLDYSLKNKDSSKQRFCHFYLASIGLCEVDTAKYDFHRAILHELVEKDPLEEYLHMAYLLDFKEVGLRNLSINKRRRIYLNLFNSCRKLNDLDNLKIVSEYLSILYEELGMKDSTIYYLQIMDSIEYSMENPEFYDRMVDLEKQKAAGNSKKKNAFWWLWVGVAVVTIIVLTAIIFRYVSGKDRKKLNSAEDALEELNTRVQEQDASIAQLLQLYRNSDTGNLSPQALKKLSLITNDKIDAFHQSFQLEFPEFIRSLYIQHPQLNSNDINVILLCILQVDSAEQARILGIAMSSLRIRRYRLKKKLGGLESDDIQTFSEKLFTEYLSR